VKRQYQYSPLKFFKLVPQVKGPAFATEGSACFDIYASLINDTEVMCYDSWGDIRPRIVQDSKIPVAMGDRMLIPTNLVFDIPSGWSVRLHPRSGLALKRGLVLANQEGVIDSDYIDPVFVILTNLGHKHQDIYDGDRICQGEMIRDYHYNVEEVYERPRQKTDRQGGFGSTGT